MVLPPYRYDPDWLSSARAFPISVSMLLSSRIWSGDIWSGDQVNSFFYGLLPDDQAVRDKIAARELAESAGTFDLLAVIGRDCVGVLRFVPAGLDPGDPVRMTYRPVSDEEIYRRISSLGTAPLGVYADEDDFRISIAGVQEKTAFLWAEGQWQFPHGTTPTSHIFKPAMKEGSLYDVMSASPYFALSAHKVKLAMAVGESRHYRLKEIQIRYFYQTGQKAGLGKQDMDDLFYELATTVDNALLKVEMQARLASVPDSTSEPILDGIKKRIKMIE